MTLEKLADAIVGLSASEFEKLRGMLSERFEVVDSELPEPEAAFESYMVRLNRVGEQKLMTIKVVREATGGGLKEAKDLVDSVPSIIGRNMNRHRALEVVDSLKLYAHAEIIKE